VVLTYSLFAATSPFFISKENFIWVFCRNFKKIASDKGRGLSLKNGVDLLKREPITKPKLSVS